MLGLVGPVSVYCDWVRWKVWSATSISVWQHVKLSEQIRPWDTLVCWWDIKQPTSKQQQCWELSFYYECLYCCCYYYCCCCCRLPENNTRLWQQESLHSSHLQVHAAHLLLLSCGKGMLKTLEFLTETRILSEMKIENRRRKYFPWEKNQQAYFFPMKIKMMDLCMQTDSIKLIFVMNFSMLDFFKYASRMPQIAQILVSTFKFSGPPRNWYHVSYCHCITGILHLLLVCWLVCFA